MRALTGAVGNTEELYVGGDEKGPVLRLGIQLNWVLGKHA